MSNIVSKTIKPKINWYQKRTPIVDQNGNCGSAVCLEAKRKNRVKVADRYRHFNFCRLCRTNYPKDLTHCPCCGMHLRTVARISNKNNSIELDYINNTTPTKPLPLHEDGEDSDLDISRHMTNIDLLVHNYFKNNYPDLSYSFKINLEISKNYSNTNNSGN